MRTILTTVGTSLAINAAKHGTGTSEHELLNYLRHTEPEEACAETNSLSRIVQEKDKIRFLCSQTEEGRLCARVLTKHYRGKGHDASVVDVRDLTYTESRFKMRGLRSLVATLIREIKEARKRPEGEVLINATGGFKAEIAYATLVGLLFDTPVYYIHEAFKEIIEMPPTPIGWDYSLLAEQEDFFEWLQSDLRTVEEAETRLKSLPREVHLLLAEEEGYVFLSPAGEAFYEAYYEKHERATGGPLYHSEAAAKTYQNAAPEIKQRYARALRKLRAPELRTHQSERHEGSDCFVFPRGHCDERLWYFVDRERNIYVCELSRHSDGSYDRLLERGVARAHYSRFSRWSDLDLAHR